MIYCYFGYNIGKFEFFFYENIDVGHCTRVHNFSYHKFIFKLVCIFIYLLNDIELK